MNYTIYYNLVQIFFFLQFHRHSYFHGEKKDSGNWLLQSISHTPGIVHAFYKLYHFINKIPNTYSCPVLVPSSMSKEQKWNLSWVGPILNCPRSDKQSWLTSVWGLWHKEILDEDFVLQTLLRILRSDYIHVSATSSWILLGGDGEG